jgi:rhamnogalacturonan endolyase
MKQLRFTLSLINLSILKKTWRLLSISIIVLCYLSKTATAQYQVEKLDRGLVGLRKADHQVFLSWRLLADDPKDLVFDIYRESGGKKIKLNKQPLDKGTFFIDSTYNSATDVVWHLISLKNTRETALFSLKKQSPIQPYFAIPIVPPSDGNIDEKTYTYSANDASVADLDGDGIYEIILKWEPSNAKNPPQPGLTGNQIIDAYKLDGKRLWRIDLGKNIRAGAAYTQFLVYDFDGDGKAELICKTADGTIDGIGKVIGDGTKDYRNYESGSALFGKVVTGPEFLTVFDGLTGRAINTIDYIPNRYPLNGWGGTGGNGGNDNTGGRADRFTAGVAYLDGIHPSVFFVRGWYGRTVIAAYRFEKSTLVNQWVFDSKDRANPFSGMANHSVSVADLDNDGMDEICVGAMVVDYNGKGLYTTGFGHGDAMHVTKMDPSSNDVSVFGVHEIEDTLKTPVRPGVALFKGKDGTPVFTLGRNIDVGRGVAGDIDPRHVGFENWGGPGGLRDLKGNTISKNVPNSANFLVWWDGDLTRELLDKNRIDKWDWHAERTVNILTAVGASSNNGTKATPTLSADIFGDWREEVIWRTSDNKELRIYLSTISTPYRMVTLMQDPQYRTAVAGQNVAYNQPPHPSFYLGEGMKEERSKVVVVKASFKKE